MYSTGQNIVCVYVREGLVNVFRVNKFNEEKKKSNILIICDIELGGDVQGLPMGEHNIVTGFLTSGVGTFSQFLISDLQVYAQCRPILAILTHSSTKWLKPNISLSTLIVLFSRTISGYE